MLSCLVWPHAPFFPLSFLVPAPQPLVQPRPRPRVPPPGVGRARGCWGDHRRNRGTHGGGTETKRDTGCGDRQVGGRSPGARRGRGGRSPSWEAGSGGRGTRQWQGGGTAGLPSHPACCPPLEPGAQGEGVPRPWRTGPPLQAERTAPTPCPWCQPHPCPAGSPHALADSEGANTERGWLSRTQNDKRGRRAGAHGGREVGGGAGDTGWAGRQGAQTAPGRAPPPTYTREGAGPRLRPCPARPTPARWGVAPEGETGAVRLCCKANPVLVQPVQRGGGHTPRTPDPPSPALGSPRLLEPRAGRPPQAPLTGDSPLCPPPLPSTAWAPGASPRAWLSGGALGTRGTQVSVPPPGL